MFLTIILVIITFLTKFLIASLTFLIKLLKQIINKNILNTRNLMNESNFILISFLKKSNRYKPTFSSEK